MKITVIFRVATLLLLALLYNTIIIFKSRDILTINSVITRDEIFVNSGMVLKHIHKHDSMIKYILQWTPPKREPFIDMGEGQEAFISRKCPYTNCVMTTNRSLLDDYINFDAIVFEGPEIIASEYLPKRRSLHQKFVYATMESPMFNPVCSNEFDGYFNWSCTFKLDSEIGWGYIVVRDNNNTLVGPNKEMHWKKLEDMEPISDEFKKQLQSKTKAAAWFVSNCDSRNYREIYVKALVEELKNYNLEIDIYGSCGSFNCPRDEESKCDKLIKNMYYFYLSFENSFSEDYVTEKLLRALQNDAVPIVFGGANYTRFMPEGIYLDTRTIDIPELAKKMDQLIKNPEKYAEFFKWKKYYSYHWPSESVETDPLCLLCSNLNNKAMVEKITIYTNFRKWWDPPMLC